MGERIPGLVYKDFQTVVRRISTLSDAVFRDQAIVANTRIAWSPMQPSRLDIATSEEEEGWCTPPSKTLQSLYSSSSLVVQPTVRSKSAKSWLYMGEARIQHFI